MGTVDWEIVRRFREGRKEMVTDRVVVEQPLEVVVNGLPLVALMRLPGNDKELAVGFCLTEKVIPSVRAIKLLRHCGTLEGELASGEEGPGAGGDLDRGNVVELEVEEPQGTERFASTYVVRTGCGGADLKAMTDFYRGFIDSRLKIGAAVIYDLGELLTSHQEIFRGTGGTHGAAVFSSTGEEIVVREDIGRHNALDKVVGYCALQGVSLDDKLLVISGRISYEMVLKAVRVRFPFLISLAAPTSLGLRIAGQAGITVVGFLDGRRYNVYTHAWRIED
jgi:FdhD protein